MRPIIGAASGMSPCAQYKRQSHCSSRMTPITSNNTSNPRPAVFLILFSKICCFDCVHPEHRVASSSPIREAAPSFSPHTYFLAPLRRLQPPVWLHITRSILHHLLLLDIPSPQLPGSWGRDLHTSASELRKSVERRMV